MKFGVRIMPRSVLLDTQGRTVEKVLKENRFEISNCRIGKFIEIEVPGDDEVKAQKEVERMIQFVLFNPLTESFSIELLKDNNS